MHACSIDHWALKDSEARCECGHLVAKVRATGVELKCKRCKRIILIPFEPATETMARAAASKPKV